MAHTQKELATDSWTEVADAADVIEMMQTQSVTGVRYISQTADPTTATVRGEGMLLEKGDTVANWTLGLKLWARSDSSSTRAILNINVL